MTKGTWVFGLSIDEDVRWAATKVDSKTSRYTAEVKEGRLCELTSEAELDLHECLAKHLTELKKKEPQLFRDTAAVGVSTVGIVDTRRNALINFDRRPWTKHIEEDSDYTYIVDFGALLSALFERKDLIISAHNDATAKGLAEFEHQHRKVQSRDDPAFLDLLFYANFHDGVNGGFVRYQPGSPWRSAPVETMMHQELGHISPPPHPHDNFDITYSGCLVHKRCFVGVASGARVRKQWKTFLPNLKFHPEMPWPIMAYYIAHFCYNAVLTMPPTRILLAGNMICAELLDPIRTAFKQLNTYEGRRYIDYPALRAEDFISEAGLPVESAGILGGLELARRALTPKAPVVNIVRAIVKADD